MTQPECTSEVNFRLCKSVFATLAAQGIISQEDVRRLIRAAAEQYHAPIGELEVNGIAVKRITRIDFPVKLPVPAQPQPRKRVAAYARV